MDKIAEIAYTAAVFEADGKLTNEADVLSKVPQDTTDLFVVSHGWNNTTKDAEDLYTKLFTNFAKVTSGDAEIASRKLAIVGVIWPARKFTELMSDIDQGAVQAGGAASVAGAGDQAERAAAIAAIEEAIDKAAPLFAARPEAQAGLKGLKALAPRLADEDTDAEAEFVTGVRALLNPSEASSEDATDFLLRGQAGSVFEAARNAQDPAPEGKVAGGGAAFTAAMDGGDEELIGHAAGLGKFLSDKLAGVVNGVTKVLNKTTYYEMKQRAGTVGRNGVGPLIDKLAARPRLERVHLVGHSFGGRVVSGAAMSSTTPKLHSLALLQAAFSHNGFSHKKGGFFRSVVDKKRVAGPILVTHTKRDTAVGWAYPRASWLAQDKATAAGGPDDPFGAIGSNGALADHMETDEVATSAKQLLDVKGAYTWTAGKFHNLHDTQFIIDPEDNKRDAHGFVFGPQIAWAISRAMVFRP